MTYPWSLYFCLFLGLWSAVIGGVFSAFSEFIMAGLRRAAPAGGIESMQHINRTVIKTQFVAGILSIAAFSIALAIYGLWAFEGATRLAVILAPVVYLPTVFLMTVFGNVPMNKELDSLPHNSDAAARYWKTYVGKWTRLNHVRSLGSLATAVLYLTAAFSMMAGARL